MTNRSGPECIDRLKRMGFQCCSLADLLGITFEQVSRIRCGRRALTDNQRMKMEWLGDRMEALFEEFNRKWRKPYDNAS